ncbi:hypothetical protein [Lacimicrobium alkaliphilum]|uniref:Lipoprotein n=1 Tax=Lacimicrobium alkaliphilum TaxID=1526571 RepID=A0A0U2ZFZ8_9ALTE|nr:hypothetical protein [Lacimicrobium alkaliphilum]ALS97372.1 hypothetical protein AT746_03165 [Lacimicrobium alkaliphilum]
MKSITVISLILVLAAGCSDTEQSAAISNEHWVSSGGLAEAVTTQPVLAFEVQEGRNLNAFYRQGPVAAHLSLTEGLAPRLIAAFPAGNSGVGIWFDSTTDIDWDWQRPLSPLSAERAGQRYYGIQGQAEAVGGSLRITKVLLGSIRVLRNYHQQSEIPEIVDNAEVYPGDNQISWKRQRLDGQAGYLLNLKITEGSLQQDQSSGEWILNASDRGKLAFSIQAMTSETALTPLDNILRAEVTEVDNTHLQALRFLSYEEKLLAGSWRFLTYFGRDTLLSLRLLMPVLSDDAIESALGSVFERMSPKGRVAHEEDIGEFALLRSLQQSQKADDSPQYDYEMLDDDLMLLPIVAEYLLDERTGQQRREAFIARRRTDGKSYAEILGANIDYLLSVTRPFYQQPSLSNLIGLAEGHYDGNWRDSEEGLDGARYPYDVNAALAPAALRAALKLHQSGLLNGHGESIQNLAELEDIARHWQQKVPPLFFVKMEPEQARKAVLQYSKKIGLPAAVTEEDISPEFAALALNADGAPVPVIHSDTGFDLLFSEPDAHRLQQILRNLSADFPLGLYTSVGMLVANPVYASVDTQERFGSGNYHGTVVWSWQQAMVLSGIERQLRRTDLPESVRAQLRQAQDKLWQTVSATEDLKTSELWSWSFADGHFQMKPFGQSRGDITESNPIQLWSTVYLAVRP